MDLNEILSSLGEFDRFQLYLYCLSLYPSIMAGIVVLSPVFLLGQPSHRCFVDSCDQYTNFNDSWHKFAFPNDSLGKIDGCRYFETKEFNVSCDASSFTNEVKECTRFVYNDEEFKDTAVTEWDVVCGENWKVSFTKSLSMSGILLSALIFGYLSDRYGRKNCFNWAPMCALVSLVISSFAPKFWVYVLFAPLLTFFTTGMYQTAFVLGMEFVGNKWRIWCGNGVQIAFSLGELILCLIAYLLQRWRKIEICIAAMAVPLLLYPWLIKESVRWQISKGRFVKALKTMELASKWNKVDLPDNLMYQLKELSDKSKMTKSNLEEEQEEVTAWTIFKNSTLRRWSINLFFCWAVNALVYYGLSLQASNIGGSSVYVSFAFLAAVEIPFIIVINMLMQRFGNKIPLIAAMVIGGISCIVSAFTPNYSMYLAVIGKGCIAASFSLIYIYSVEIYPTVVRSAGIGMCIMISRFGAIAAPYISDLKIFGESGPIIMCGLFSFIAGILVIDLPETHKRNLPEKISVIKQFKRFNVKREQILP